MKKPKQEKTLQLETHKTIIDEFPDILGETCFHGYLNNHPKYQTIRITDPKTHSIEGAIYTTIIETPFAFNGHKKGDKIMLLYGINPKRRLANKTTGKTFYESIKKALTKIAKQNGITGIYNSEHEGHQSNREDKIIPHIKAEPLLDLPETLKNDLGLKKEKKDFHHKQLYQLWKEQ